MDDVHVPSESQVRLISIARRALEDLVLGGAHSVGEIRDPYLQSREYGAFVSLHKGDELRGCIGTCTPSAPLYQTVMDMTEAAALRDRRVAPVYEEELNQIRIDISVLSRLSLVQDPLSLEVGKHGLHIARGGRRGVLLPQIATQYRWDIKTFLEQTCLKAGLPKNAWKTSDTIVSSFNALIIEERP
jgi:AmmeMemoRadiSam system protein A